MAAVTLFLEAYYTTADSTAQAVTVGFVVFSLMSIALGLTSRSEKQSIFSRDSLGLQQLGLFALALGLTFLGTFLLRSVLGTTPLSGEQWGICIAFSIGLVAIEEVVKLFIRARSHR